MGSQTLTDSTDNVDAKNAEVVAATLFGRISDNKVVPIEVDSSTHSLTTMDIQHSALHDGCNFVVSGFETVANSATVEFVVETPDTTTWTHMTFYIQGTDTVSIEIYENTDADADGTVSTPINNNRNSSVSSTVVVRKDPTINSDGDLIFSQKSGDRRRAGLLTRNDEIILKQNTKYLFKITSFNNGNVVTYVGSWYECENKD